MLVNAVAHPGPAMFQGLMLMALPVWAWLALRKEGKYFKESTIGYVLFGVLVMLKLLTIA